VKTTIKLVMATALVGLAACSSNNANNMAAENTEMNATATETTTTTTTEMNAGGAMNATENAGMNATGNTGASGNATTNNAM
jgi:uncharacterized lipoprotein